MTLDLAKDFPPAAFLASKFYAMRIAGIDLVGAGKPSYEDTELYYLAVLTCAAADGELAPSERAFIASGCASFSAPMSLVNKILAISPEDVPLEEILVKIQASETLKYTNWVIVYHTIMTCSADGDFALEEYDAVKKVGAALGLDAKDVDLVRGLELQKQEFKAELFKFCFRDDSTWTIKSSESHILPPKAVTNAGEYKKLAEKYYALFECGVDLEQSGDLTQEEKEIFTAVLLSTAATDGLHVLEEEYILGFLTAMGFLTDDMLSRLNGILNKFPSDVLIEQLKISAKLNSLRYMLIFQAIAGCSADAIFSSEEEADIKKLALALQMTAEDVDKLLEFYKKAEDNRSELMNVMWPLKNPYAV
mmetsp:Transcript_59694/g.69771  ORF Transcript_59694/g.69771 Transcript_59694/m.69771 type:complete len:363 (-) Transcript_59694:108-1196(-)|eukprot:CAMPEP_0194428434 /NCGR_PEP_ID=MMETSP0176-20130528/40999_1 /TAXON_ID=216777 /ORGANISM="Proboscia alata, Strain PI-D3" /LENGTH=362 /DNA_ID=CAMNT_0039240801 /DNA_START=68 /DNA_END=1156 /DNA_ORIENTATION=+